MVHIFAVHISQHCYCQLLAEKQTFPTSIMVLNMQHLLKLDLQLKLTYISVLSKK